MAYDCYSCSYLDKSRKVEAENKLSFRYGCNKRDRKCFVVGWVIKDRNEKGQLGTMGCSDWIDGSKKQMTNF